MMPSHRTICPLSDYGIQEATQLVILNSQSKKVSVIQELSPGASYVIRYTELDPHLNYSFKIQVMRDGQWIDHRDYERVISESVSPEGIKYQFYPDPSSRYLVVIFQAIQRQPTYGYIGTLRNCRANKLYIKDDYGDDPITRSSYYVGKNRSFDIDNDIQRLLLNVVEDLGIERSHCIFCGSSKGGFASIYHGYKFGAGTVLAGGPQILLGDYLNSRSKESIQKGILKYLAGDTSQESVSWANGLIHQVITKSAPPYPNVIIHVGNKEPHYRKHVLPFLAMCASAGIRNVEVETADYSTHDELATHFPIFLKNKLALTITDESSDRGESNGQIHNRL